MSVSVPQVTLTGGEWSPSLFGRTDLAKYYTACRTVRICFCHTHGGASNRGGTGFVGATKVQSSVTKLIPFEFSIVQNYMLVFGQTTIQVIKDGGFVIYDPGNGLDIVDSVLYKWTVSASGTNEYYLEVLAGGNPNLAEPLAVYEDVGGADTTMTEGTLGSLAVTEWAYGDNDSLGYSTIYVRLTDNVDPDTKADGYLEVSYRVEIATPYSAVHLAKLKHSQSADVLYLTHPTYSPRKLTRTAHDTWTLSTISFAAGITQPTGFYRFSGTGTGWTFTVTAVNDVGEESVAAAGAAGGPADEFRWNAVAGAVYYNFYATDNAVSKYLDKTTATGFVVQGSFVRDWLDASKVPPTLNNPFNATDDYPGACAFFEQRLMFARTNNKPQTLWGSVTGSFENMNSSSPIQDDDSFEFSIPSTGVNEIRWMVFMEELIIGTSASEWKMSPGGDADAVTPTSVRNTQQSRWGSSDIVPLIVGESIIISDNMLEYNSSTNAYTESSGGRKVRSLFYDIAKGSTGGYSGNELSVLSDHLFEDYGIAEWCYQKYPDTIVWAVREDGELLGMTFNREHEVWAWHRHDTGASGEFESIASLAEQEVYCVVKRTINGGTKRYIERFMPRFLNSPPVIEDAYFVDCGLSYNGSATTTLSGLDHLEGETVVALADGNVIKNLTVASGSITLPIAASKIHVGLAYTAELETMDFEIQTQTGTLQDKRRQIPSVVLRLRNTRGAWVGPSSDRLVEVLFREDENYDTPTDMFTGDKEVFIHAGEEREGRVFIQNSSPVPMTVYGIIPRIVYGES